MQAMKFNPGVAGAVIAIIAMGGVGLVEVARGEWLPGLHPYPDDWARAARLSGALLVFFGTTAQWLRISAIGLAFHWLVATGFAAMAVAASGNDPLAYVPLAQTLVFTAFALWLWGRPQAWTQVVLRIAFGAMLILFGAIHLTHVDVIAGLIPDFVPGVLLWPWITGGVQVLAGVACVAGRGVFMAGAAISAMYAAWLPIVHGPRLLASPESAFEWTFALTALALTGVALTVASPAVRTQLQDQR
jgi:hypothetical protein